MSELKRCPFCGGEVKLHISELDAFRNVYSFLCNDCDMEITYPYSNEEEAIKAFNTRKPMEKIVERLEEYEGTYVDVDIVRGIIKEEGDMNE